MFLFLLGQILNLFSKDIGAIDEIVSFTLYDCLQVIFSKTILIIK